MSSISLREYDYSTSDDKDYRLHCMTQCLDENSTTEFIKHCLYVGQFQETLLDDFLCLDLVFDDDTQDKVLELKRKHGYHEAKREFKKKIEDLENERQSLLHRVADLDWKADRVDFMEQYTKMLRNKITELHKDVERLSEAGEERVHGVQGVQGVQGGPIRNQRTLRRYNAM